MGTNYWVMKRDYPFASWMVSFPPQKMTEPSEMLPFVQQVLAAAEREEVYRVTYIPLTDRELYPNFKLDRGYRVYPGGPTYGQYLEQILIETGKLVFFRQISKFPGHLPEFRTIAPARLSYYDADGALADQEVEDVGELLQQLRPMPDGLSQEDQYSYNYDKKHSMAVGSAIFFSGDLATGKRRKDRGTYLFIKLYTDIWFPQVYGYLEPDFSGRKALYDNRELALRHTPRLNQFLASVKELTLEHGGTWEMDKATDYSKYLPMKNENGIILDI